MSISWEKKTIFGRIYLKLETSACEAAAHQSDKGWTLFIGSTTHNRPSDWSEERVKFALAHMLQSELKKVAAALETEAKTLENF